MIEVKDFSFLLVTQATDLVRLSGVYSSIRLLYPENEIVVVYENGSDVKLNISDNNLVEVYTEGRVYVSKGYNLALKNSTKRCFVFVHDDTYIAKNFLESILPNVREDQFCNFTTVEPPMYNNVDEPRRPIKDFGRDPRTFKISDFNAFCKAHSDKLQVKVVDSPFGGFFMSGYKSSIMRVGGFDERFVPYFHEDGDLMIRLHQAGYRFVQALDALVYHMGSLTSRSSEEGRLAHDATRDIFLRKWKVSFDYIKQYTMLGGIPYKNLPVEIECKNCSRDLLHFIDLISEPGSKTKVTVDQSELDQQDFQYLQTLPYVLQSIEEPGNYQLGNLKINHATNE